MTQTSDSASQPPRGRHPRVKTARDKALWIAALVLFPEPWWG